MSMLVHQAHLGAFALRAQFLGSIDCEEHRLSLTAIGTILFISVLDQPMVLMPDDDVSSVRHDLLLAWWAPQPSCSLLERTTDGLERPIRARIYCSHPAIHPSD